MSTLKDKIQSKTAQLGVIGLGYVGLPLVTEMAKAGFHVTGFDINEGLCSQLNEGRSHIEDISNAELQSINSKFRATSDFSKLKDLDCVSICVPTPLGKTRDPDISYILSVRDELRRYIHKNMLVVLESTTYPGTTEEIFLPLVEAHQFTLGENFYLAFSPERIDPGNKTYTLKNTPKVVGGVTPECTNMAFSLYSNFVDQVVPVASPRSAEMVKILENTYRAVNIGLVNEVAIMCKILDIDTWEVIDAAATKPFGFTPFYPGPGLGGHCIPVDPHYLAWKLKTMNYQARFIDLAAEVNTKMPNHVLGLAADALNEESKSIKGSKILLLGMSYKPNISDTRESPALDIYTLLKERGADVNFCDPHCKSLSIENTNISSKELNNKLLAQQDLVIITTNHKEFEIPTIVEHSKLILDTRNATKGIQSDKIVRL